MSYQNAMDAIQLKMPEKIPRTEYSASVYWGLIRAVTGIPVDSSSGEAVKRRAMMAFEKAWDFGFTWSVLTLSLIHILELVDGIDYPVLPRRQGAVAHQYQQALAIHCGGAF